MGEIWEKDRSETNHPIPWMRRNYWLKAERLWSTKGRVSSLLTDHGRYDISAFISELFGAIYPSNFVKSMELEKIPGIWADVYSGFEYEGENWYVKFFIDAEGTARLNVMSANWDGYIH